MWPATCRRGLWYHEHACKKDARVTHALARFMQTTKTSNGQARLAESPVITWMILTPLTGFDAFALSTATRASVRLDVQITARKRMAGITMCTTGELRRCGCTTQNILGISHGFQVIWITTRLVKAKVVENQAVRNGTASMLVDKSMKHYRLTRN